MFKRIYLSKLKRVVSVHYNKKQFLRHKLYPLSYLQWTVTTEPAHNNLSKYLLNSRNLWFPKIFFQDRVKYCQHWLSSWASGPVFFWVIATVFLTHLTKRCCTILYKCWEVRVQHCGRASVSWSRCCGFKFWRLDGFLVFSLSPSLSCMSLKGLSRRCN